MTGQTVHVAAVNEGTGNAELCGSVSRFLGRSSVCISRADILNALLEGVDATVYIAFDRRGSAALGVRRVRSRAAIAC